MNTAHGILLLFCAGLCLMIAGCVSEPAATDKIPQEAFDWNGKGINAYEKGNYTEALGFFDLAIQAEPEFSKAWNNRGITLVKLGRYPEAADAFNRTLEIDPLYPGASENRDSAISKA